MINIDLRFHSLESAFEFANKPLPARQRESSRESRAWAGSTCWDSFQTVALSRSWEPLECLKATLANPPVVRTARRSEVPGILSVSRYLAGDDKPCTRRQRGTAKRLRVAAGMSYSKFVSVSDATSWGITLIQRLASLRAQGIEVTVDVIFSGLNSYEDGGGVEIAFCVPFIDACLLVAHPSSLRRLVFAIMERANPVKVADSYGKPSQELLTGYDLTFNDSRRNYYDLVESLDAAFGSAK